MCRRISAGLGSSGRLATVSEKCIHSVAWPSTKPQAPSFRLDKLLAVGYCGTMNKKEIIEEIKAILKDYHYNSDTENMSQDVVIALENLVKN